MKRATVLALFAAAVIAAPAAAQREGGGPGRGPMFNRNPVAVLVDSAQVLGLGADQVTQLRTIAQELDVQNKTPLDSLQAYRPQGGGGMGGPPGEMTPEMRERMEHARPFMQQVRENNRQAMDRAMELLTPEQREHAQAMLPRRRGPGGPGGPGGPPQP
jgi:hypothetical protein